MTVFQAIEHMARTDLKQIALLDDYTKRHVTGIVTQSMIIELLKKHQQVLGDFANITVGEMINTGHISPVKTISQDIIAINAFTKMRNLDTNCLAVVDTDGMLQDNISVRDIRGIGTRGGQFSRLFVPIKDFKRKMQHDDYILDRRKDCEQTPPG